MSSQAPERMARITASKQNVQLVDFQGKLVQKKWGKELVHKNILFSTNIGFCL